MKRLLVMLLPVLLLIGCGKDEQTEPDKEVSGGMENQEVVLSIDAIQEPEQIKFNMSLKNQSERAIEFQFSTGQNLNLSCMILSTKKDTVIRKIKCLRRLFKT